MTAIDERPDGASCTTCFGGAYIPELGPNYRICQNRFSDHFGHVLDAAHACGSWAEVQPEDELVNPGTIIEERGNNL